MPRQLVGDNSWKHIESLLPKKRHRKSHTGRLPLCDRKVWGEILSALPSDIPWEMWPEKMGCGSGKTC